MKRAALALGLSVWFGTAGAEAEEATTLDVTSAAPAPAPTVARSAHVHDGFYLRVGLGTGPLGLTLDDDRVNQKFEAGGFDLSLDLRIGGTPSTGVVIGGALFAHALTSAELEENGRSTGLDPNVGVGLLGPFLEGYPDDRGGLYGGGALGLARVQYSEHGPDRQQTDTAGFGLAIWIGYDIWVGDEWSIGPALRFMSTITSNNSADEDLTTTTRGLTLSFSGTYH